MNSTFVKQHILPKLPIRNKRLGVALISHLYEPNDEALLDALRDYQNLDGGFGQGLEADIQMKESNVASTDIAIGILDEIQSEKRKESMIKGIVSFLESVYNEQTMSFEIVPALVDRYPHAVWWNYDQIDSFTYGNPNPEVAGFLWKYQHYSSTLDIHKLVQHITTYIQTTWTQEASMHSVLSVLRFYKYVDMKTKEAIYTDIQEVVDRVVEFDSSKWNEYTLEPYKIARIEPLFLEKHKDVLKENIALYEEKIQSDVIRPNWQWYQFEDTCKQVIDDWIPLLTYDVLYVIKNRREQ